MIYNKNVWFSFGCKFIINCKNYNRFCNILSFFLAKYHYFGIYLHRKRIKTNNGVWEN